jgi:hypothetical protein
MERKLRNELMRVNFRALKTENYSHMLQKQSLFLVVSL